MSELNPPPAPFCNASGAPVPVKISVARQPVFDAKFQVRAWERLYRDAPDSTEARIDDGAVATARVAIAALMDIGLERLAGSAPVHVKLPEALVRRAAEFPLPLPPARVVLEVLEDIIDEHLEAAGVVELEDAPRDVVEILGKGLVLEGAHRGRFPVELVIGPRLRHVLHRLVEIRGVAADDQPAAHREVVEEGIEDLAADRVVGDDVRAGELRDLHEMWPRPPAAADTATVSPPRSSPRRVVATASPSRQPVTPGPTATI
ncbi:MAG: hypothetical protein IT481_03545 [Gammaproteobacteria bacterium]|nr:hypothetical protein [Gammaproteobacteria bacterium]